MNRSRQLLALAALVLLVPAATVRAEGKSNVGRNRHLARPVSRPITHQGQGVLPTGSEAATRAARSLSQANRLSGTAAGVTRGSAALHHASTRSGRDLSAQVAGGTLGHPATAPGSVNSQRPNAADLQQLADGTAESWQAGADRNANNTPSSESPVELTAKSEPSQDAAKAGQRPHQAKATPNRGFWFRFR